MQPATYLDHTVRLERLVTELRSDLGRPVSLGEMGEIAAMSPFHLTRVVRERTGMPPVALHGAFRLQEAKRLLLATDATVTDACFAVGFSSLGSFSSRFTSQVGATPSEFKRSPTVVDGHADRLLAVADLRPCSPPLGGIAGEVIGEGVGDGLIFIGVFPAAIARGVPICGDVLSRPGRFAIPNVPDGRYMLLVACLPSARTPVDWVMPDIETRVGAAGPITVRDGRAARRVTVPLRRREPWDPPVLLSMMATPRVVEMSERKLLRLRGA